jgi:hypothetical protein
MDFNPRASQQFRGGSSQQKGRSTTTKKAEETDFMRLVLRTPLLLRLAASATI